MSLFSWGKKKGAPPKELGVFAELLRGGDVAAALEFYQAELGPHQAGLPRALRVAYHLQRWVLHRQGSDLQAVRQLAAGAPPAGPVGQAWQTLQLLNREHELAQALRRRDPGAAASPPAPGATRAHQALEAVSQAAAEAAALSEGAGSDEPARRAATTALRLLAPQESVPSFARRLRAHLYAWAALRVGRYECLLEAGDLLRDLPDDQRDRALPAAAFGRACQAAAQGQAREAARTLESARPLTTEGAHRALTFAVGMRLLEAEDAAGAVAWFTHHYNQCDDGTPADWWQAVAFGLAVARLKAAKYQPARVVLSRLEKALREAGATQPGAPEGARTALAQCYLLTALSLLAGTEQWGRPGGPAGEGPGGEAAVQNRAMWNALRDRLAPLVNTLAKLGPRHAWRGHLLAGLFALADSSATPDPARIQQFSAAIDQVESETAQARLRAIEGTLTTRARATEEAARLVRDRDAARLRELRAAVLDPLGDAVPPPVRAAVYMTLWREDPAYNPLPDLQRIPADPAAESLVGRCAEQVRLAQAVAELREECLRAAPSGRALPALAPLADFDPGLGRLAAVAAAVVHLRRGNPAAAAAALPGPAGGDEGHVEGLRFRIAWLGGDAEECRRIAAAGRPGWHGGRGEHARAAVLARALLQALEADQPEASWDLFRAAAGGDRPAAPLAALVAAPVVWLLERDRPRAAQALLRCVQQGLGREKAWGGDRKALGWVYPALQALVAARMAQHTACGEAVGRFLGAKPPEEAAPWDRQGVARLRGWMQLVQVLAELAATAAATDDLKLRWRAARRSLEARLGQLPGDPALQPYAMLVRGLLAVVGSDTLVDDATVQKLQQAQRSLSFQRKLGFLEAAVSQLNLRKQLLAEFWNGLRNGELARSREVHQQELVPAFGQRLPASIRLGVILLDCAAGAPAAGLLERLAELQRGTTEFTPALFDAVRAYLEDAGRYAHLARLLNEKRFDEAIEAVRRTEWLGFEPGTLPLPAALAQMFAFLKTRRTDEALALGRGITGAGGMPLWMRDAAFLLFGYTLYDVEKYPDAAAAFEQTSGPAVLGHDADRYWAASRFSHGLQLLAVDRKEEAFEAFAGSFGHRGRSAGDVNLAPLFIHFGLRNIEARNGGRARHSFELLRGCLDGAGDAPGAASGRLLADLGERLCRALTDEDVSRFGADGFLELLDRVPPDDPLGPALRRALRVLAVCQELRRQVRLDPGRRSGPDELYALLGPQVAELDRLRGAADPEDPALLVLKGAADLLLRRGPHREEGLLAIEQAMRLGASSPRLAALVEQQRQQLKARQGQHAAAYRLIDAYLMSGGVPERVRAGLLGTGDLDVLYRLNRHFAPGDLVPQGPAPREQQTCGRLEHLREFIGSDQFRGDGEMQRLGEEVGRLVGELKRVEAELLRAEAEVMKLLAGRIRTESAGLA